MTIYRDTGAQCTLLRRGVIDRTSSVITGKYVSVRGLCGGTTLPVHRVYLRSDFVSRYIEVAVVATIPFDGVDLVLGNDVVGGRVFTDRGNLATERSPEGEQSTGPAVQAVMCVQARDNVIGEAESEAEVETLSDIYSLCGDDGRDVDPWSALLRMYGAVLELCEEVTVLTGSVVAASDHKVVADVTVELSGDPLEPAEFQLVSVDDHSSESEQHQCETMMPPVVQAIGTDESDHSVTCMEDTGATLNVDVIMAEAVIETQEMAASIAPVVESLPTRAKDVESCGEAVQEPTNVVPPEEETAVAKETDVMTLGVCW